MKRQFVLDQMTVLGCSPPEMTYIAARAGYDFVNFRLLGRPGEPDHGMSKNKDLLRRTKTALAETGVKLHDIGVASINDGIAPKSYLPEMEAAAELGACRVMTNAWSPERNFVVETFAQLCEMAKPLGLTMEFEFVTWAGVTDIREALELIRAAKSENAGILVDTLHFDRSRCRLEELEEIPRELLHFVHLCDAPKEIPATKEGLIHTALRERLYVGEGSINIAAILKRLPEIPYSIESPHLARAKELGYTEHAFRCLEYAKNYLDANL